LFFNLKSLITRVILLNILILSAGIAAFTVYHIRREQLDIIDTTRDSAKLLLSTIEKSIFNSMRVGNTQDVQIILEMVGRNRRLRDVRIFHPDGTILKSADPDELGKRVRPQELELFTRQEKDGILHIGGEQVLGLVQPIYSDEQCFLCHGAENKVLGILNLNISLDETFHKLRESSKFYLVSTALILVLLAGGISFILLRLIKKPIRNMAMKMRQVEGGDLTVRMNPRSYDEIGSLMYSFNAMVLNLEKAKKDLEKFHYGQMERADRLAAVGEMATGIAHEIKNPLAGISGAISVLASDYEEDDPRREIVGQILGQINRLDKTATDLLHFGKPGKPEFSHVDLNSLVQDTLFFVAQHPEARKIHRIKDLNRNLPPIWADEKQLQQVLFNIIINAIQSMKDRGGTLRVRTEEIDRKDRHFVRISIADTGEGIPEDELGRIFAPFYTTKTQGTGLGLPICRQLLEQHGGTIRVESRLGEGSTFILELPSALDETESLNEAYGAQT